MSNELKLCADCDGWIRCAERLPEEGQTVIVFGSFWNIERYPYSLARVCNDDPATWFDCPNVTHWRPLPAPPTESEAGPIKSPPKPLCKHCGCKHFAGENTLCNDGEPESEAGK